MKVNSKKRVYICHTYYHLYIAVVRELVLGKEHYCEADLVLSTMSNNFEDIDERIRREEIFNEVFFFHERWNQDDPEIIKYKRDRGNVFLNLLQRLKYTKIMGRLQEGAVPVDLKQYDDVFVFCDSDPIGYYLNYKKIRYHALEDGLNSGRLDNQAKNSNLGMFKFKCLMAKMGLIFIECGYSKYCIDYVVNDISMNIDPPPNIVEWRCNEKYDMLTEEDHRRLVRIFLKNADEVCERLSTKEGELPFAMILTEPLCDLETRERIFGDLVKEYRENYRIIIKPHPRDELDYAGKYPETYVLRERFPMEVFNDIPGFKVGKLISVITQVDNIRFAKEIDYLGLDFLDKYEDPSVHRKIGAYLNNGEANKTSK